MRAKCAVNDKNEDETKKSLGGGWLQEFKALLRYLATWLMTGEKLVGP